MVSMYISQNGLEADGKIVVEIHNPRGGGGWSHLLVHRGGTALDEGVLSWAVCQLSSSGYEPPDIGRTCIFFPEPRFLKWSNQLLGAKYTSLKS